MTTTGVRSDDTSRDRERQGRRPEARGGRHPRLECRSREGVRREPRVAGRRGFPFDNGFGGVRFTPPGSGGSVQFGTNITSTAPGSARSLYLIVSDIGPAVSREWDLSAPGCLTPGTRATSPSSMAVTSGAPEHYDQGETMEITIIGTGNMARGVATRALAGGTP
jgi:hypothetical protein